MTAWKRREVIGGQTLLLGDCREIIAGLTYDAVLADPPYGLAQRLQGGTWGKKFDGPDYDWDASAPDAFFLRPGIPSIIWGGNYMNLPPSRCWLVWHKRDAVRTMADCELAWTSFDSNARVFDWTIAATNAERVNHPTQKPVALMKWCLGFIPDARTILDPFAGSGTVAVACQQLGRCSTSIEIDPDYFDIACRRVEAATRQPDMFITPPPKPQQETLL